jgi:hypothetical protein
MRALSMLKDLVRTPYHRFVRPHLPRKFGILHGVAARHPRLFDSADVFPEYEAVLIGAMGEQIEQGDHVIIVGGGFGISTVHAARMAGMEGEVTTYEASDERHSLLAETIEVNDEVSATVNPVHALVGTDVGVAGSFEGAAHILPADLPDCDVLVMDCEGAELDILQTLDMEPRALVVETHGNYDASTMDCKRTLTQNGFSVIDCLKDNPKKGIDIVIAVPSED